MTEPDAERPVYVVMFGLTEATAKDIIDPLRGVAAILRRRYNVPSALNRLWRTSGLKNPLRRDAGKTGGIAASRSMTAEERITRAHKGGVAAFYRGGNASTYGKYLVDRREKKRRRSRLNLLK